MIALTFPIFIGTLMISITVTLFLAGSMTVYFGEKRTREAGIYMIAISVLIILVYYVILRMIDYRFSIEYDIIEPALFFLIAMATGTGIGLILFLAILIKH